MTMKSKEALERAALARVQAKIDEAVGATGSAVDMDAAQTTTNTPAVVPETVVYTEQGCGALYRVLETGDSHTVKARVYARPKLRADDGTLSDGAWVPVGTEATVTAGAEAVAFLAGMSPAGNMVGWSYGLFVESSSGGSHGQVMVWGGLTTAL